MMDILMYLFETYIHSEVELQVDQDTLSDELSGAGFPQEDIHKALNWLEKLAALQESPESSFQNGALTSMRVYTELEMQYLNTQCRGFLLFLEQVHVLGAETREMVIERVMELETSEFYLDDLKWVVLMVLFNVPGHESAYHQMEDLLYESENGLLH